ncbi:hypothetical protein ACLK2E_15240 [Escherichia coli]
MQPFVSAGVPCVSGDKPIIWQGAPGLRRSVPRIIGDKPGYQYLHTQGFGVFHASGDKPPGGNVATVQYSCSPRRHPYYPVLYFFPSFFSVAKSAFWQYLPNFGLMGTVRRF